MAMDATLKRCGKIDALIHNAGLSPAPKSIFDLNLAEYERIIRIV